MPDNEFCVLVLSTRYGYLVHTLLTQHPPYLITLTVMNSLMSPNGLGSVATTMPSVAIIILKIGNTCCLVGFFFGGRGCGFVCFLKIKEPPGGMTSQLAGPYSLYKAKVPFHSVSRSSFIYQCDPGLPYKI